jgi:hypothetical protein
MTTKNREWNENKPKFNEGDYVFEKPNVFDSGIIKSYAFSNGIHRYIVDFFGQQIGYREDELALVGCVDDLKKALEISPKQKLYSGVGLKDFNTFTPTAKDFEDFVNLLAKNNINFHPEDDFNDYYSKDGSKTFPNEQIAIIVGDNFDIARETLKEKVFWKICFNALKSGTVDYVEHFAKLIAERFPEGNVDVSSEVDSIQIEENLEENDFITSTAFDSKVREKLSQLWEQVDCDKCNGKGYYFDDDNDLINCPRCHGEGTLPKCREGE